MMQTKKAYIETYGCQMNVNDSEVIFSILADAGYARTERMEEADLVMANTCSIRDNAEQRIWGRIDVFNQLRKKRPGLLVGIAGCMAERLKDKLLDTGKVDLVAGPDAYRSLSRMLEAIGPDSPQMDVLLSRDETYADITPVRTDKNGISAFISIMRGCNNVCSYCVVPYTRGAERSRDAASIVREACDVYRRGYREVTLLGQNVDSYLWKNGEETVDFAALLGRVADVAPDLRVRFATSHPKDISDELIGVMATAKHVCHALHLPVQHGNDRVLQSMNRKYTREKYLERVASLRAKVPDISLTTDLIVGYPGETEEDFEATCSLVEQVGYDSAFTFIYSPRVGTRAADMPDQIPEDVSSRRIQKLIAIQKGITHARYARYIGQVHSVLVDESSRRDENQMAGKNEYNITVNFPGSRELIGQIVRVRITSAGESTLRGELV